jgi:hypothetical protein
VWIDNAFPKILGAELYRPHPEYIAEMVIEPTNLWDATKFPGDSVQLDRYSYWGDPGSKESRRRNMNSLIGTSNSRSIEKTTLSLTLQEFTGPGDPSNPNAPSTFKIPLQKALFGQRLMWAGRTKEFHESIGSITLLDDYRKWRDRVFINELLKSSFTSNPEGVPDGGTYASGPPSFSVKKDLLRIVERLRSRNVPRFSDGNYRAIVSPRFMTHLRQDNDFREVARYPGFGEQQYPTNQMIFGGGQYNQAGLVGMVPGMPSGIVFEGVRFFESTNMPLETVNLNYTATTDPVNHPAGMAPRTANLGLFFGMQSVGVATGGEGPVVELNNNDDFSRFIIAIWKLFGDFGLLNEEFVEVVRTYGT